MMRGILAGVLLAASAWVPLAAAEGEFPLAPAPDYSDPASWLCGPESLGFCTTDLDASVIEADGTVTVERWRAPEREPAIDCFYLYPTASLDMSPNSDLVPGDQPGEEIHTVRRNFARFSRACRLFAPIYRSTTLSQMRGLVPAGDREVAYADVLAAWNHYLEHDNGGRGVVLVGHSQGSAMIRRLLMEQIDGKPAQRLLVSALPIGNNFAVPEGRDVGGDLKHIPLCRERGQTGCLITYNTFRAAAPPPENAVLGGRIGDGMRLACVNPAALGGGEAPLDAYLETRQPLGGENRPEEAPPWVRGGAPVETPYVRVPGLLSGECKSDEHGDYLALTIHADPADPRVDDILGEVRRGGEVLPEWGFHVIDMELAMGDLVRVVEAQATRWAERSSPAALEPYLVDGLLPPGDYRWAKGRFDDATEQEKADSRTISEWMVRCWEDARVEARARLAFMGYPGARLETAPIGPLLCRQVSYVPYLPDIRTFAEFSEQVRQAAPIADAYLMAVAFAEQEGGPRGTDLSDRLLARTLGEQVVRHGLSWGQGRMAGKSPELSPVARAIVMSRLLAAMAVRDHANTEWLKGIVAEHGWPKVSEVGEQAATRAWLLVQHADHDPVFQLEALRLMEPLVAQREVSPNDFAYLTDRIMLKLTGKQRYGTQFQCVDGQHTPQPIEDEAAVDRLRSEAGMETQAENTARMRTNYGSC